MAKKPIEQQSSVDYNSLFLDYAVNKMEEISKKEGLVTSTDSGYFTSSGLLALDYIMGGGIRSGWITTRGFEASGKTSLSVKMLGALARQRIPGIFFDAEGTLNFEYACRIAGMDLQEVFGSRSPNGKGWEKQPLIMYSTENTIEKVFGVMKQLLKAMPDKVYRAEKQKWYLVFKKDDKEKMEKLKLKPDAQLLSETGMYWCEAPDARFQMVFLVDSLHNLITTDAAESDDSGSSAMALEARAFKPVSTQLSGLLRRKHAVFLPVNQLKEKIGVMFGNPESEPGGNSLKICSQVRNQMDTRAVPTGWEKGTDDQGKPTSQYSAEPSVQAEGAVDNYAWKFIKNIKNKNGTPFKNAWTRIWIKDYTGQGQGFDPVFDCYQYLAIQTKQIPPMARKRITGLGKFFPQLQDKQLTWEEFKRIVLAEYLNDPEIGKPITEKYGVETFDLYQRCFDQFQTEEFFDLLISKKIGDNFPSDEDSELIIDQDIDQFDATEIIDEDFD